MPHPCDQITKDARLLERAGMTNRQLSQLHHFALSGRTVSFTAVARYFGTRKDLREANTAFGRRLRLVASEHARTGKPFDKLVVEALLVVPLTAADLCNLLPAAGAPWRMNAVDPSARYA
jgi:hypothetical protein